VKIFDSKEQNEKFNRLWETDEGFREKILDVLSKPIAENIKNEEGPGEQILIHCVLEDDPSKVKEEISYPAINYGGFKFHFSFSPKESSVFKDLLNDLNMSNAYLEKNLEKIKKNKDDQEEVGIIFSQSLDRVKTNLTKTKYALRKISSLPEEIVNFFVLEMAYPHIKTSKLRGILRSKTFIKKANRDFYSEFQKIEKDFEGDPDTEYLDELEMDLYYCFLNLKVLLLYEEENEKGLEIFKRRQEIPKDPQKEPEDIPSIEPTVKQPKKKKREFSEEYLQSILEFVAGYVNSASTMKRLEKYVVRVMQAAYVNKKPAPIDSILDWVKNFVGIEISKDDEYMKIEQLGSNYGYIENEQPVAENISKDPIQEIVSPEEELKDEKERPFTELDFSDVTATKVIEIFEEQGFYFENEKVFQKQFDNLMEKTSYSSQKKKKLAQLLTSEENGLWVSYPNNHYVMKLDAGGEALRIVKKEKSIRDFLNHYEYERKYVRNNFSK
jgi:hypothetical protein